MIKKQSFPKKKLNLPKIKSELTSAWAWHKKHKKKAGDIEGGYWGAPVFEMARHFLPLIYQGKAKHVEKLLKAVWPKHVPKVYLKAFRGEFVTELRRSPVWSELVQFNGGSIMNHTR